MIAPQSLNTIDVGMWNSENKYILKLKMPPAALARLRLRSTKAFATENEFFQKLLSDLVGLLYQTCTVTNGTSTQETESDPLIRTTKKEAIVEPGLIFVKRLIPLLKENASALPKCVEWLQKISESVPSIV
jgi:hypothetical protein